MVVMSDMYRSEGIYGKGENDSCIGGLPALNISTLSSFLLFEAPINADPGKRSGVEGVALLHESYG